MKDGSNNPVDSLDRYEDDGEGYGSRAWRNSSEITTTYGGWMTMFQIAMIYDWEPEGGSYYSGSGRTVSTLDAWGLHISLEKYIAHPEEAYDRWRSFVAKPDSIRPRIFPMGDERYDPETGATIAVSLSDKHEKTHWNSIGKGGAHLEFAKRFSKFCALGEFSI